MQPTRVLDTRTDPAGPLGPATTRTLRLSGTAGIPTDATAVVVNLTGTQPTTDTYLTVWPSTRARPTASNLNLTPDATHPNLVITGLGPDGAINLYNDQGTTHALIDVVGYLA